MKKAAAAAATGRDTESGTQGGGGETRDYRHITRLLFGRGACETPRSRDALDLSFFPGNVGFFFVRLGVDLRVHELLLVTFFGTLFDFIVSRFFFEKFKALKYSSYFE